MTSTDPAPTPPTRRSAGSGTDLVTGAFGNTGAAIARQLVEAGRSVRTLTGRPRNRPNRSGIEALSFTWDDPRRTAEAFEGVDTFYNTFWMRMGDGDGGYDLAVERCEALIDAAETAGVRRIVHISVAHPSASSPYPYFRGKARVEARLRDGDVPAAVVRPTLVFGGDSVLLNNLAWMLRRLPVLAIPGSGRFRVRPVHVDDLARTCVDAGAHDRPVVVDAVGPDRPTYRELVEQVRAAVGSRTLVVPTPTGAVLAGARVLGTLLGDDVLDRDELVSSIDGLADSAAPSTGTVSLATWLAENGSQLGHSYVNERRNRR